MRCLVGTYRNKLHVPDALKSLDRYVTGITDLVFINDSPDPETSTWLSGYGKVVDVGGQGYGAAMKALCAAAEGQQCLVWEEDFTATVPVDLTELSEILYHRPYLAQIALLRGPHFPIEHQHGGLLEALIHKGHTITQVGNVLEQTATFTANPSVWRGEVFQLGWPTGRLSEELKRDQLLNLGYRFGFMPDIRVNHHGERTGHGY